MSETGNEKNVTNFQDLISFVVGYLATYNLTKKALNVFVLGAGGLSTM